MKLLILISCFLFSASICASALNKEDKQLCYSVYNIKQNMDLIINFGGELQRQKKEIDMDIHIREINIDINEYQSFLKTHKSIKNIRSYIALVEPNFSKTNGVSMELSSRYSHPFLVMQDADSGEIIDLKSTVKDPSIINEYMSFFDLFQYSSNNGEYKYRNGNGHYNADIEKGDKYLVKQNTGYLKTSQNVGNKLKLQKSEYLINISKGGGECFYKKSTGSEILNTVLAENIFVNNDANIEVSLDPNKSFQNNHFFYSLTYDLSSWPNFSVDDEITRKQAFEKLPGLVGSLSQLIDDDTGFIDAMLKDENTWKYLADYFSENNLSTELSVQLFWALDKIDTTKSVDALVNFTISSLPMKDQLRISLALGSTSASFGEGSVDVLKNHVIDIVSSGAMSTENVTFVRMMGAMASNRNITDPQQSSEIKQFLYSQSNNSDENIDAVVIDAIGNLKDAIDEEGKNILMQGLSKTSDKVRLSAASAFKRVPYKQDDTDVFIEQFENENNMEIKGKLVEVMAKTTREDLKVKQQFLSIIENERDASYKNKSLKGLKKIDYDLQAEDISLLENKLSKESNIRNQRLFASLILKQRRRNTN